jgi:hypothetical protein
MKRFLVSNFFVLILFMIAAVIIMSLDLPSASSALLMVILSFGVLVYAALRLIKFEKDIKKMPTINFEEHRIENKLTGKVLYQFSSIEWEQLSLDEKYDMARWFTLA